MEGGVKTPDEPLASFFDLSLVNPTPTVINEALGLTLPEVRLKLYRSKFWREFMLSNTHWHKFIVLNGASHEKEIMLKAIVSAVQPGYFLPVMYHTENSDSIFYAEHCNPALDRLFRTGMCVSLPNGEEVNMEAVLCYIPVTGTRVQVRTTLFDCVWKRYNRNTFALNLVNFHKDPELYDLIYYPLSEPRNLSYILKIVRGLKKYIRSLYLAENELTVLQPLTVLTTIKVLDLGSNKLKDVDVLNVLQQMMLTELVVDSNPLCMPYNDSSAYIRKMKSIIPTLNKLDGMLLCEDIDLCWYRNYLISHKSHALVDQFLEHYFTLFDGDNRNQLQGIYHEKAVFSMTARYLPGQSSSSTARLSVYTLESRNLLKMPDCTKSFEQLSCGPEAVLATLCKLPRIKHDPYSFAVDCVQYSDDHAVINVTGVFREFRELSTMNKWPVRWFNRTFILLRVASQQYQIVNEMLHVSIATSNQSQGAFHIPRCKLKATSAGESMSDIDKREMMEIFSQLTEMNSCWAEKYLDNSKWDIRDALQVFTELLKMNQIPKEAFVPEATPGVQLES